LVGNISNRNCSEIGEPCSRAHRSKLGYGNRNLIVFELILEALDFRKRGIDSRSGMRFGILSHKVTPFRPIIMENREIINGRVTPLKFCHKKSDRDRQGWMGYLEEGWRGSARGARDGTIVT
jgi:hypothetical protein